MLCSCLGVAQIDPFERSEILWMTGGHSAYIGGGAVSPNGAYYASCSDSKDGTVKLWDSKDGHLVRTLVPAFIRPLFVTFTADSAHLVALTNSGVTKWNVRTGVVEASVSPGALAYESFATGWL
jgi:WD40 repeat protein